MPLPHHITALDKTTGTWESAPTDFTTAQHFSRAEYQRRLDGLRAIMDAAECAAVVTTSVHSTLYYSNFWMIPFGRHQAAVIPRSGPPSIVAPLIEGDRPKNMTWFEHVSLYSDARNATEGAVAAIAGILADLAITRGRIGVEADHLTPLVLGALEAALPDCQFVDVSERMMRQRLIKSSEEIALIRQGAEVADLGAHVFVQALHEGAAEFEVARAAVSAMEAEIARRFPTFEVEGTWAWCQSGMTRTMSAHAPNTTRRIQDGDLISLNVFPMIAGYYHALERTLVFGTMSQGVRRAFEVNVEAHQAGIAVIRPGEVLGEFDDRYINPIYEKAGLLHYRTFGTGHSFGIMGMWYGREEGGENRPYNPTVIEENMVLSMEPMIAIPGLGGFRHHDILLVTRDGNERLTRFPNDILQIGRE